MDIRHSSSFRLDPQLSISTYFDDEIFPAELTTLFSQSSTYLGHRQAIPEVGDYYTLPQENDGRVLIHTNQGIELLSNVCRHRQAIILKGRGSLLDSRSHSSSGNIVCPLHRWTYSGVSSDEKPAGQLIGAPHFKKTPSLHLNSYAFDEWNGLLFESKGTRIADRLADLSVASSLSFSGYVLDRVEMHECQYNWKTFIEVYLEDYHVEPFHPGLGGFVTCDDLRWEFSDHYSVQTVGINKKLQKTGVFTHSQSPSYQRWYNELLRCNNGIEPKVGAVWFLCYPNVMIEHYPNLLTISTLHPISVNKTLNIVEFYHPEEIYAFERNLLEAQQTAYMETCLEDDEIAERMDQGRYALLKRGDDEWGPYQQPMEIGMKHFHQWYRQALTQGNEHQESLSKYRVKRIDSLV